MSEVFCTNCQHLVKCGFELTRDDWMYYPSGYVLFHGDYGCTRNSDQVSKKSPIHSNKYLKYIVEKPEAINFDNNCKFFIQKEKPVSFWLRLKEYFKSMGL